MDRRAAVGQRKYCGETSPMAISSEAPANIASYSSTVLTGKLRSKGGSPSSLHFQSRASSYPKKLVAFIGHRRSGDAARGTGTRRCSRLGDTDHHEVGQGHNAGPHQEQPSRMTFAAVCQSIIPAQWRNPALESGSLGRLGVLRLRPCSSAVHAPVSNPYQPPATLVSTRRPSCRSSERR